MGGGLSHGWPCSLSLHPCWSHILVPGPPSYLLLLPQGVFSWAELSVGEEGGGGGHNTHTQMEGGPSCPMGAAPVPSRVLWQHPPPHPQQCPSQQHPSQCPKPLQCPPEPWQCPPTQPSAFPTTGACNAPPAVSRSPSSAPWRCPQVLAVSPSPSSAPWHCPQAPAVSLAPAVPRGVVPKPRQCPQAPAAPPVRYRSAVLPSHACRSRCCQHPAQPNLPLRHRASLGLAGRPRAPHTPPGTMLQGLQCPPTPWGGPASTLTSPTGDGAPPAAPGLSLRPPTGTLPLCPHGGTAWCPVGAGLPPPMATPRLRAPLLCQQEPSGSPGPDVLVPRCASTQV